MGAAILDRKSWGPPSWIGSRGGRHLGSDEVGPPSWCRGGRHLGPEVMGTAILVSRGPPSWTGSRGGRHLGVVGAAILDLTS